MARKAMPIAAAWLAAADQGAGMPANRGSIRCAMVGSPTQPSARLAKVMPSWVAATASSRCSTANRTASAPNFFSSTSCSTRVQRTVTSENSAATKKALSATRSGTISSPRMSRR